MSRPDPLQELRETVRATTEAAERLVRDAPPPQGWATPGQRAEAAQEAQALIVLLGALRDAVPPDLWEDIRDVLRRLLLVVRALLDHLVERLDAERPPPGAPTPQDIPLV